MLRDSSTHSLRSNQFINSSQPITVNIDISNTSSSSLLLNTLNSPSKKLVNTLSSPINYNNSMQHRRRMSNVPLLPKLENTNNSNNNNSYTAANANTSNSIIYITNNSNNNISNTALLEKKAKISGEMIRIQQRINRTIKLYDAEEKNYELLTNSNMNIAKRSVENLFNLSSMKQEILFNLTNWFSNIEISGKELDDALKNEEVLEKFDMSGSKFINIINDAQEHLSLLKSDVTQYLKKSKDEQLTQQQDLVKNLKEISEITRKDYEKKVKDLEVQDEDSLIQLEELKKESNIAINKWKLECQRNELLFESQKHEYECIIQQLREEVELHKNKLKFCNEYHNDTGKISSDLVESLKKEIADLHLKLENAPKFDHTNEPRLMKIFRAHKDSIAKASLDKNKKFAISGHSLHPVDSSVIITNETESLFPSSPLENNVPELPEVVEADEELRGEPPNVESSFSTLNKIRSPTFENNNQTSGVNFTLSSLSKLNAQQKRVIERNTENIRNLKNNVLFLFDLVKDEEKEKLMLFLEDGRDNLKNAGNEKSNESILPQDFIKLMGLIKEAQLKNPAIKELEEAAAYLNNHFDQISNNYEESKIEENASENLSLAGKFDRTAILSLSLRYSSTGLLAKRFEVLKNRLLSIIDGTEKDLEQFIGFKFDKGFKFASDRQHAESYNLFVGITDWINLRLQQKFGDTVPQIKNITKDLADGVVIMALISIVFPSSLTIDEVKMYIETRTVDPEVRIEFLLKMLQHIGLDPNKLLSYEDFRDLNSDIMFCFVTRLMYQYKGFLYEPNVLSNIYTGLREYSKNLDNLAKNGLSQSNSANANCLLTLADEMTLFESQFADIAINKNFIERRFLNETLQLLTLRYRKGNVELADITQMRNEGNFGFVPTSRVQDILTNLDSPTECDDLNQTINLHKGFIKRVFKFYSAGINGGNATSMSNSEYRKFIKDIKIYDVKTCPNVNLDLIFMKVNRDSDEKEEKDDKPKNDTEREMSPLEFMEALVRIAALRYLKNNCTLTTKFNMLMENYILKYACQSDHARFRREIASQAVSRIFQEFDENIHKIYEFYAQNAKKSNLLILDNFLTLCKDAKVVSPVLSQARLAGLFSNVQHEDGEDDDMGPQDDNTEMQYSEFIEVVAALAVFRYPDPFLPLNQRIQQYLVADLFPAVSAKIKNFKKYH